MTVRPRGRINRFGRLSGPCAAACDCLSRLGCALRARAVEQVRQTHKETWVIARRGAARQVRLTPQQWRTGPRRSKSPRR